MSAPLPPRTRAFAALMKRLATPVEEATDYAELRAQRLRLMESPPGRLVFGRPDRRVRTEEIDIPLKGRTLRAIVHRPTGVGGLRPAVVNFHGGGWVQGSPEQSAWLASRLAAGSGAVVVSPSYRLAPEHPYPAAVEDTWEALGWIAARADGLGLDADRLAVMGDSAGGNLAAVAAQRSVSEGGPALRAQVLIYPAVEMYDKFASELRMPDEPVLSSANMSAFAHLYMGDAYGTEDPLASPLRATSFDGLPPAFILTADHDPLLDNGVHYREALQRAGVPVRYREYPGTVHGFVSLPGVSPAATDAASDIVDFVAAHVVVPR
ncbi:alpha/beta hydrolase [Aeromicrobium tamlense]|uniref:Acetyl esterase n=1 Tax=Aeromicrobium tamlense TaxID=375541 RepID=A0A8I0FWG1_9ACTN|nr:alpha/beta hydrolase [Aeromicrobium tamlense]MBD1271919.1 alpha/beta hydrolase [Aeromicrobium tamlense]NYI38891.1 acetyl esterase [Aeromicrobium tamlense]